MSRRRCPRTGAGWPEVVVNIFAALGCFDDQERFSQLFVHVNAKGIFRTEAFPFAAAILRCEFAAVFFFPLGNIDFIKDTGIAILVE